MRKTLEIQEILNSWEEMFNASRCSLDELEAVSDYCPECLEYNCDCEFIKCERCNEPTLSTELTHDLCERCAGDMGFL